MTAKYTKYANGSQPRLARLNTDFLAANSPFQRGPCWLSGGGDAAPDRWASSPQPSPPDSPRCRAVAAAEAREGSPVRLRGYRGRFSPLTALALCYKVWP